MEYFQPSKIQKISDRYWGQKPMGVEEPWRQNAASGEFFARSCYSFVATSGVLMTGFL